MLARLQAIPDVRSAVTDVSGRMFLVELASGVSASDVEAAIATALGGSDARRLTDAELARQLGPPERCEPWFGLDDLRTLSYIECRLVAARVSSAVGRQLRLDADQTERVADAVREEMFVHVERIHAGQFPSGRFLEAWPGIARRAMARRAEGLHAREGDALLNALVSMYRHTE